MAGPGTKAGARASPLRTAARWLSAEDRSILALETETVAGHTCKVIVLADRVDAPGLRAAIAPRLPGVVPLHLRLETVDGRPCWAEETALDLAAHVVSSDSGGEPVDDGGLRRAVARLFEQRLDRSRPLWRIDVVPCLEGGGSALVWRVHHAVADGSTFMRIAQAILWDAPEGAGRASAGVSRQARPAGHDAGHRLDALGTVAREVPHPWHRTPFNGHIDARRAVAFASADLQALRAAARATDGATVNDAVLTVVSGGLRRWLESMHGRLGPIRVKVPVSLHHAPGPGHGDEGEPGNRDSFFCLDLPLGPADPVERLREVHRSTRVRKDCHDAEHLDALMIRLGHVPRLRRFAERVLAHPRSFALNVSNVPGPRRTVDVMGVPVRSLHSLAEIREHHALRIAVVSLAGRLHFGVTADPTLVPDVERLAAELEAEAAALVAEAA